MIRRLAHTRPIPIYWLVVGVAVMVVSPLLSIRASVVIAENNAKRIQAEQRAADQATRAASTRLACAQFGRLIDVYDAATTPIGREVRDVYVFFYSLIGCQPPRK